GKAVMFACIYGRSVSEASQPPARESENLMTLVDLAFTFSPLVEQTTTDTVVLDISGQDLLFGGGSEFSTSAEIESAGNVADEIYRRGKNLNLKLNIAVAANPDAAIHAARSFKGVTIIPGDEENSTLSNLSIKRLDFSLAAIEEKRAEEVRETFALWGVRTFGELARLLLAGVAERLGQDGVRLQKLAQGNTGRSLNLVRPPIGFEQSLELEHPVTELEPLSFILSRLLNQLCANLNEYALATNELRLRLVSEPRAVASGSETDSVKKQDEIQQRTVTLPVPMRNPKTLLRLLLFEIERQPPQAPIVAVTISATPVKPRASQTGLFIPIAPEPEKLEITLARLAKLVGAENVGSPELLDTHRPDAFRMKKFRLDRKIRRNAKKDSRFALTAGRLSAPPVMGFRNFRPAWRADVRTNQRMPIRVRARSEETSNRIRGDVVCASGPWRGSGDWWRADVWARDEWDVAVLDSKSQEGEVLCRIYRDLTNEQW